MLSLFLLPFRSGLTALCLIGLALPTLVRADSLAEIVKTYQQSFEALRIIDCRYEIENHLPPERENLRNSPKLTRGRWTIDGNKSSIDNGPVIYPNGNRHPGSAESYDGDRTWNLNHQHRRLCWRRDPSEFADNLRGWFTPGRTLGHYFTAGNLQKPHMNLVSLLSQSRTQLVGQEVVNGHNCWRIDFPYPGIEAKDDLPMTVWLDPQHGCLPRRLQEFPTSRIEVLEFQRVQTGAVWFPWRIQFLYEEGAEDVLQVQEVTVNRPIDPAVFRPVLPKGYETLDLDNKAAVKAFWNRAAAKRDSDRVKDRADQNAIPGTKAITPGTVSVIDARPRYPSPLLIGLTLGGLGLFLVSALSLWKLHRPS